MLKNLFGISLMFVFALFVLTQTALAQRNNNCNVNQNQQQTSAAAAVERAQITSVLQAQSAVVPGIAVVPVRSGGTATATATASSGPSVAALRAAAVPVGVTGVPVTGYAYTQSAPAVITTQAVPVDPSLFLVAQAAPVSNRRHIFPLSLPRTQVTKSTAITRTTTR